MKIEEPGRSDLPTSLLLVTSVILTIFVALFLAVSDDLQTRLPAPIQPTVVVLNGFQPATALPPASATPTPTNSVTPQAGPTTTPTPTAVSIIAEASCNNAPSDWVAVVIGSGESVYTLSAQYGATVSEIVQANCLETTAVFPGSTLYLPVTYPTRQPCGPPYWWIRYRVRPGDTLFILAQRHRTTVYAIMQANCLNSSQIQAGVRLFLPPLPATMPPPPTVVIPTKTPTPTATQLPSVTPNGTSTARPSPTATSAVPSGTPTPTSSPAPTNTPTPTATATTTPATSPTATPTTTPGTTDTPVPSPTATPPPTATPTITNTPVPTATSSPPPTEISPPTATATP